MANGVYEVTWSVRLKYTRIIEAGSKREALEISADMGNAGAELEDTDYSVSAMRAKLAQHNAEEAN
jgi:hypothetical protein